jgi:hypothetical protein
MLAILCEAAICDERHLDGHPVVHQDARVRTTLTLDPEVERLVREAMHRERKTFKEIVNWAIRRALAPGVANDEAPPFRIEPHEARLLPGRDPGHLNRLADELEDDRVAESWRERRS